MSSQANHSLYSYHIIGMVGNKPTKGGTGFFIRKSSRYYFVTAWHCFTHKHYITKQGENVNDSCVDSFLIYKSMNDMQRGNYIIIPSNVINYREIYYNNALMDISAIDFYPPSSSFDFNFMDFDNYLTPEAEKGSAIFYYGFPIRDRNQVHEPEYFDGVVLNVEKSTKEITIKCEGYVGCSGAPLFVMKNHSPYLLGVLFNALKDAAGKAQILKAVQFSVLYEELP